MARSLARFEQTQRRHTAYHEAGHVVAYWSWHGFAPVRASVEPDPDGERWGHYERHPGAFAGELGALIQCQIAGDLAESIRFRKPPDFAQEDDTWSGEIEQAWFNVGILTFQTTTQDKLWVKFIRMTRKLLRHYWPKVEAIAAALLKHGKLDHKTMNRILNGCTTPCFRGSSAD